MKNLLLAAAIAVSGAFGLVAVTSTPAYACGKECECGKKGPHEHTAKTLDGAKKDAPAAEKAAPAQDKAAPAASDKKADASPAAAGVRMADEKPADCKCEKGGKNCTCKKGACKCANCGAKRHAEGEAVLD